MIKIIGENGTGKTKRLMEEALKNNGVFVCKDVIRCKEKAMAYGIYGLPIISYHDYTYGNFDLDKPVFIHKLDSFLEYAEEVSGFSLTV